MQNNNLRIDLHTHSTASDGTLSPSELAQAAKSEGLSAIALTDHDTVDGTEEFTSACGKLGIEAVSGVEISAEFAKEMHIVGLFVNKDDAELRHRLSLLKNGREVRNRKMLELIRKNGMDISEADILAQKKGATLRNTGRAHIARAMVEKGYVKSANEAFTKYLKKGNCCYVKRITLSPEESIQLIKKAGGTAILAHPMYITQEEQSLLSLAAELKEYGLDGMECYYNCHSRLFTSVCESVCKKLDLLPSGGSDFHGSNKPSVKLGHVSVGSVPYRLLLNMKIKRGLR